MSPRKLIWTTEGDTESAEYHGSTASITRVRTDPGGTVTISVVTASHDSDDTAAHLRIPVADLDHRLEELREHLEEKMMKRARARPLQDDDTTARFRLTNEDSSATTKIFRKRDEE